MSFITADNQIKFALKKQIRSIDTTLGAADALFKRVKEMTARDLPKGRERCYALYRDSQLLAAKADLYTRAFMGRTGILPSLQKLLGIERYGGSVVTGESLEQDIRAQLAHINRAQTGAQQAPISREQYLRNLGVVEIPSGLEAEYLRVRDGILRLRREAGTKSQSTDGFHRLHRELAVLEQKLAAAVEKLRAAEKAVERESRRIEEIAGEKAKELALLEADEIAAQYAALYRELAQLAAGDGPLPATPMGVAAERLGGFRYVYPEDIPEDQRSQYFESQGQNGYPALFQRDALVLTGNLPQQSASPSGRNLP